MHLRKGKRHYRDSIQKCWIQGSTVKYSVVFVLRWPVAVCTVLSKYSLSTHVRLLHGVLYRTRIFASR